MGAVGRDVRQAAPKRETGIWSKSRVAGKWGRTVGEEAAWAEERVWWAGTILREKME